MATTHPYSSSMASRSSLARDDHYVSKGKDTRSWQQLPPEIIRSIATYYLLDMVVPFAVPGTFRAKDLWPQRMVFAALRQAAEFEKLMNVCPAWGIALEYHLFWRHVVASVDPYERLHKLSIVEPEAHAGSANSAPIVLSPYSHFRNIRLYACVICRINAPHDHHGLGETKRVVATPLLGAILTCKEHRPITFCGVCLRVAPPTESDIDYAQGTAFCCVENEDEETWPGVEATCRPCRSEWLLRRASTSQYDLQAIGGPHLRPADWETRQSLEAFLDLGEGTITDVIVLAREKHWLRLNTQYASMMKEAVVMTRLEERAKQDDLPPDADMLAQYGSEEELSEEDDDEDPELMSLAEDRCNVRDNAFRDWARNRILDGHWINPADQWYGCVERSRYAAVRAVHPCPWQRGSTYSRPLEEDGSDTTGNELEHPRPKTVKGPAPPTYHMCEQSFKAYNAAMREILLPPMANIVRRLVIECAADGQDPTVQAAKMTLEDVLQQLNAEGIWWNGIDWLERRANERQDFARQRAKDDDASSTSSRSDASHSTSPVLSTTTLQTTPSPPPIDSSKEDYSSPLTTTLSLPISVSPVLKTPKIIHSIPYLPKDMSHMGLYSVESFNVAWREACAPLYHCRCSICERAVLKANVAAGNIPPSQASQVEVTVAPIAIEIPAHEEEGEEEEDFEDGESEKGDDTSIPDTLSESIPDAAETHVTPRKRSSRELDVDAVSDAILESVVVVDESEERSLSPPKRARRGDYSPSKFSPGSSPTQLRKRSSEELDNEDGVATPTTQAKRARSDAR